MISFANLSKRCLKSDLAIIGRRRRRCEFLFPIILLFLPLFSLKQVNGSIMWKEQTIVSFSKGFGVRVWFPGPSFPHDSGQPYTATVQPGSLPLTCGVAVAMEGWF